MMEETRGKERIRTSIEEAAQQRYVFRFRKRDQALVRFKTTREFERLVEGSWVYVVKPWRFGRWDALIGPALDEHARRYMVEDLVKPVGVGLGRWSRFWRRGILRWVVAPLPGGAERKPKPKLVKLWQDERATEILRSLGARRDNLDVLREQALAGYQQLADRCAVLEQRANFFLGAAGLTSTLVLANAGLLLAGSSDRLTGAWLYIGASGLAAGSVCAVVAGLRAMQAAMTSFTRCTPSGVQEVTERADMTSKSVTGNYVGALLVAQERERAVGDWKLARLKAARRWFSAAIVGVAILTVCVLANAVF